MTTETPTSVSPLNAQAAVKPTLSPAAPIPRDLARVVGVEMLQRLQQKEQVRRLLRMHFVRNCILMNFIYFYRYIDIHVGERWIGKL